jgi:hypothetical protein
MVRWVACRMAEAFGYGNLVQEWQRFKVEPPLWTSHGNDALSINDYCDFWTSQEDTYPALSDAIKRFVRLNPTEASCERSFSVLKFAFTRLRTCAQSDLVESSVVGMSAVAFRNRQLRFEGEDEEAPEEEEKAKEDEEDKLQPPPLNDTAVRLIMDVWNTIATEKVAKEPLLKQRRTEEQEHCGLCHELFDDHVDKNCVKCTRCYLWFVFDCVGLAPEMELIFNLRLTGTIDALCVGSLCSVPARRPQPAISTRVQLHAHQLHLTAFRRSVSF